MKIKSERTSPDEWTICVIDNGIGVPAQYSGQIFEPFKRLHGQEMPGMGIGLALCQRIVETAGGRIWTEPSTGGGATLCVVLPAV